MELTQSFHIKHGGDMPKKLFSHMDFVEYIKEVLQSDDYEFVGYGKGDKYDLGFLHGKKLSIVKVLEYYNLKPNGLIDNQTRDKLIRNFMDFLTNNNFKSDFPDLKIEAIEKILVLTNKQAFNELSEKIADYEKSGKISDNDVKLMLIPYPIIPNNFAKKECGNIVFTVSQLIGAIKSGVVKIKDIPAPYQDYMVTMMRKHGYRNFKLKDLDFSAFGEKPKE